MKRRLPPITGKGWSIKENNLGCKEIVADDDTAIFSLTNEIGYTHGMNCEHQDQANADLICAAPKMLRFINGKARQGDRSCQAFLRRVFTRTYDCDDCEDRFVCWTEKRRKNE